MKSAITYIGSGPKGPHVIYLAEGKRITVGRDKSTKGPAWLVVDDTPVVSAERTVPGEFDNTRAYREGWALFDDGQIQRLDDPQAERPASCECDNTHEAVGSCCKPCWRAGFRKTATMSNPTFDNDSDAISFVLSRAFHGSEYHRTAIKLALLRTP